MYNTKTFIILLFLLTTSILFVSPLFSNTNNNIITNIDSIKKVANNGKNTDKIDALKYLVFYYMNTDTKKMSHPLHQYILLNDSLVSKKQKLNFLKKLSQKFATLNNYEISYNLLRKADSLNRTVNLFPNKNYIKKMKQTQQAKNNNIALYFMLIAFILFLFALIFFLWKWQREKRQITNLQNTYDVLQTELEKKQRELETRIRMKTANLTKQAEEIKAKEFSLKTELKKAEETNYLKNAFLANMGFDIRTPLNSIIGFANILETELAVRKSKELFNYASNIEQSGYFLLKMLNNIIDFSSLEANTLEIKIIPVKLHNIIKDISNEYELMAKEKNLIYKVKIDDDLPPVLADKVALKKVLNQIIDNSFQYTLEGFITVSCSYDAKHDLAIIEVKDTGVGMNKKQQADLWQSFVAINNEKKYSQGTGVGLKLAKKYIEIMNGRLFINSSTEEGTTVNVQLPCSEKSEIVIMRNGEKQKPVKSITPTLHDLGKIDFFVVEDDRMNRMIIEKILANEGNITMAVDGDDCLNIVNNEASKNHYFEVMLFDINLPEPWDGVKLMKEIRKKYPAYRKIPFIAQTAYAMAGDKERFLKEGFDSYISKPIDKNELISVVRQQLNMFKSHLFRFTE